jgi:hypothetical protein
MSDQPPGPGAPQDPEPRFEAFRQMHADAAADQTQVSPQWQGSGYQGEYQQGVADDRYAPPAVPLDDGEYQPWHRRLSPGRLAAVAVAIVVVLGGGAAAAVALTGSSSGGGTPAAASTGTPSATSTVQSGTHAGKGAHRKGRAVRGTITSVATDSFVITNAKGVHYTVRVTAKTKYGSTARPLTRSQLVAGTTIVVAGSRDGTTITATHIMEPPAGTGTGAGQTPGQPGQTPGTGTVSTAPQSGA